MSFKDLTPEARRAAQAKAAATRRQKNADARAARLAAANAEPQPEPAEIAPTLAELGLRAEPEDDIRLDEILTNEEIEAIKVRARAQVAADRKKARSKILMDLALAEARRESGDTPVDEERERELAQITSIRINLPRLRLANGREAQPDPIIIDQRMFVHGRTYQVTVAQYEYLMDLMNKAWMHVAQVDGRSRTYYSEQIGTMIYQGGMASGGSLGVGVSFDAVHRRAA